MSRLPLWHLTDKKGWELDPTYHPVWAYWATGGPHRKPALFVTDFPRYWEPFMGVGPIYAVRIEAPEEVLRRPSPEHPEYLIEDLGKIQVVEILPLEEAILRGEAEERADVPERRREYGMFGHIDDWWYARSNVWDNEKMTTVTKFRARRGLSRLMEAWRERTGYKNPREQYLETRKSKQRR